MYKVHPVCSIYGPMVLSCLNFIATPYSRCQRAVGPPDKWTGGPSARERLDPHMVRFGPPCTYACVHRAVYKAVVMESFESVFKYLESGEYPSGVDKKNERRNFR